MAKNVSVDAKSTQEKEDEEEKYYEMENEVMFFLKKHPKFNIRAVGVWFENDNRKMVGSIDIHFRHIFTGRRCENVRECLEGWYHSSIKNKNLWETLCNRIEACSNLEEIIQNESEFGL